MAMTDERLAEIEADLSPGGRSAIYESDLLVFDEACELLDEVKRLRAENTAFRTAVEVLSFDPCAGLGGEVFHYECCVDSVEAFWAALPVQP